MKNESRPRVLVAGGEEANRATLDRVFRRDLDLVLAPSGAEALEALARTDFDVVLADFAGPGMNGVELLRQAAERFPATHRVLLAAHSDLREVFAAQASGLSMALVTKPCHHAQLKRLVTSLAQLSRVIRGARARTAPEAA